jgi:protein PhnA
MSDFTPCPKCHSENTYSSGELMICPDCFHEWNPAEMAEEAAAEAAGNRVLDANGNVLLSGDSVIVVKDLPVKGSLKALKAGTKVKNIRIVDGDHNIDCRVDGFGQMALKSEFVKKA